MSPERRSRIEKIFEDLLSRPRSEWSEGLDAACGEDDVVKEGVRKLLVAHERSDGLLDRAPPLLDPMFAGAGRGQDGGRIGKYELLEEIGKGGMGRVYLAERADGHFKQRVALKIIPWADPELHARVVVERQILASLEHPNIGRLLDGGITDDGRPFLVMEYVDGLPLDVYCDRMRLGLRERLKVFLTILGAVDHAHHNLIVHRDLKPSNILVTPSGTVKLLDFGIAKLLTPNPESTVTRTEERALTPEYASPEQVRGEVVTTAADVYSLGVVLYQLLSGYRPYRVVDRSLPKLVEVVCEVDPCPPSQRVARGHVDPPSEEGGDPTPEQAAEVRHTTSFRLPRQLSGDLDAIVMKAIRKEPGRRYGSIALLSQDIQHYLDGLPVQARKGNRWYRARKLVRRHRVEALATGLVLLSLLIGAGAALWQAGVAARERDRAREALSESEEVTDFLLGLFEASSPEETPSDPVLALDLLRRGEERADALAGEPVVQARMLQVMAQAYQNLGRYTSAEDLAGKAASRLEAEYGAEHPDVAAALVLQAFALRNSGEYESARVVMERAMRIQERVLGPDDVEVGRTLEELARLTIYFGDLARAEDQARRALAIQEAALGPFHPTTLNALGTLGSVYRYRGKLGEAEETLRTVLERRRLLDAPDPGRLTADILAVGDLIMDRGGDAGEAEALYREALSILQDSPPEARGNLAWALTSLGSVMEHRSEIDEAAGFYREAVEVRRRTYGDLHPVVAETMGTYASFLIRNGQAEEAERVLLQAVEIHRNTVGLDHPRAAGNLTALGKALMAQGRLAEADSVVTLALETRRRGLGYRTPVVAETMGILADIKTLEGDFQGAETLLQQALVMVGDQAPEGVVPRTLRAGLTRLYEAWGRPEEASRHRGGSGLRP